MNDRERLRGIENDWQEAIAAIREQREEESEDTRKQLAAIRRSYRRLAHLLLALAAVLLLTVAAGFASFAVNQSGQRASRLLAVRSGCEDRNRIVGADLFFVDLVAPELDGQARRVFRVQRSCDAYADAILRGDQPPATVPGRPVPPVR